ncbi:MAG: 50S ribosomal protein L18 [Candidatus Micrarchaeaceae archaeon]
MIRFIKKRRREALTNYKRRISLLKSGLDRVVVRKGNRSIIVQVARFAPHGDIIVASAHSSELKALGWEPRANMPTAYLTGFLLAQKSKGFGLGNCILDIGLYKPIKSSVVFSAAKGCIDNGMKIAGSFEVDAGRISGAHISAYAKTIKQPSTQFSMYTKSNFDVSRIAEVFEEVKKRITEK